MSEPAPSLADRISTARFTPTRMREGYDMGEVDALLDRLVAAVTAGESVRATVDGARFTQVRMREGYDQAEVDAFLADVVQQADGTAAPVSTPTVAMPLPTVDGPPTRLDTPEAITSPAPSVVQEQRGLLARLFARR